MFSMPPLYPNCTMLPTFIINYIDKHNEFSN